MSNGSVSKVPDKLICEIPDVCKLNNNKHKFYASKELHKIENCINSLMEKTNETRTGVAISGDANGHPNTVNAIKSEGGSNKSKNVKSGKLPNGHASPSPEKESSQLESCLPISEEKITLRQNANTGLVRKNSLRLVTRSPVMRRRSTPICELDRTWALDQCEELTTWVNSLLQQKDTTLDCDLKKAISDGRTLPILLDVMGVGDAQFSDTESSSHTQQEQFERTRNCVELLKNQGYTCSDVTASDIISGDLKSVILYLSGLKNFYEKNTKSSSSTEEDLAMLRESPGLFRRSQSKERNPQSSQTKDKPNVTSTPNARTRTSQNGVDNSLSDQIKWLLSHDQGTAINVDSGEQETVSKREQPLGESDSAASPNYEEKSASPNLYNNHHSDKSHQSEIRDKSSPYHRRDLKTGQKAVDGYYPSATMQHQSKSQRNPIQYNNSVPNLNGYQDSEVVLPCPRTAVPSRGNNQLSVYPNQRSNNQNNVKQDQTTLTNDRQNSAKHNTTYPSSANERAPRSSSANRTINNTRVPVRDGHVQTAAVERRPEIYPPSAPNPARSPYSQRRQLQLPSNNQSHYETIDDVKLQAAVTSLNTTNSHQNKDKPSNPPDYYTTLNARYSQQNSQTVSSRQRSKSPTKMEGAVDSLPPDVKYEMVKPQSPRRMSMPAVKYHSNANKLRQTVPAPTLTDRHEDDSDDDPDYVDISDENVSDDDQLLRSSTPPLPDFLDDNSEAESCSSVTAADDTYKYRRSVSASGKMLSAGVETFHRMMRQSKDKSGAKKRSSLAEETDEGDSKPSTPPIRREQKGVVRPIMKSDHTAISTGYPHSGMGTGKGVEVSGSEEETLSPSEDNQDSIILSERGIYITDQSAMRRPPSRQSKRPSSKSNQSRKIIEREDDPYKQEKIDKKVQKLERLYEDMSHYLTSSHHQQRVSGHPSSAHTGGAHHGSRRRDRRHSIASATSSQYSYTHRRGRSKDSPSETRAIQRRFHRLESHIVTLAKSISHLSSEMKTQNSIFMEIDRIGCDLESVKCQLQAINNNEIVTSPSRKTPSYTAAVSPGGAVIQVGGEDSNPILTADGNPQKISKLTRFFGHEPPLMKLFLKQLGYERYQAEFDSEKIGMLELPYMSEERLRLIGIPLGPRVRILQEASRLLPVTPHPHPHRQPATSTSAKELRSSRRS